IVLKKRITLLLMLILLSLLFSCSTGKTEKKYRIGFSQCQYDLWRKTMSDEMKRELSFHNNIEFIYSDAAGNSQKQVEQIQELVKQDIDLLIVSPNEIQPLTPVIEKVYDSG